MRSTVLAFCFVAFAVHGVAQQDSITWTDGSKVERSRILDFTVFEVRWQSGSGADKRSSDMVADLSVQRVLETYRRGFAEKDQNSRGCVDLFLGVARKELEKAPFMAQFGFWEAGKFLVEGGKEAEGFAILNELLEKMPDSGFAPRVFTTKLDYYMAVGKAKDAEAVAKSYTQTATTKAYPGGFLREAEFYTVMARAMVPNANLGEVRAQLERLAMSSEATYPAVAHRCRLHVANFLRQDGKIEEAMALYSKIAEAKVIDTTTRAGALLGIGHVHMSRGSDTSTEPYRNALLSFLRVYIDTPAASPDVVAEALFHGAQAAMKWGGADHRNMTGRLRFILRTDDRYSETEWAKKM